MLQPPALSFINVIITRTKPQQQQQIFCRAALQANCKDWELSVKSSESSCNSCKFLIPHALWRALKAVELQNLSSEDTLSPKRAVASLKQATTAKCSCSASLCQRAASQSKTAIMLTISYYTAKKENLRFWGKFR